MDRQIFFVDSKQGSHSARGKGCCKCRKQRFIPHFSGSEHFHCKDHSRNRCPEHARKAGCHSCHQKDSRSIFERQFLSCKIGKYCADLYRNALTSGTSAEQVGQRCRKHCQRDHAERKLLFFFIRHIENQTHALRSLAAEFLIDDYNHKTCHGEKRQTPEKMRHTDGRYFQQQTAEQRLDQTDCRAHRNAGDTEQQQSSVGAEGFLQFFFHLLSLLC